MENQPTEKNIETKEIIVQFKDKLVKINDTLEDLLNMTNAVSSLPNGQSLRYMDRTLNKRDVSIYKNLLKNQILGLSNDYQKALKHKKKRGKRLTSVEYTVLIKENFVSMFTENKNSLGPIDISDPEGPQLVDQLKMLTTNSMILNKSILPLCAIYMYHNKLQLEAPNKQYSKATVAMQTYLQDTFNELSSRPEKINSKGNPIPVFNKDMFKFTSWSSIVSLNRQEMDDEHKVILAKGGLERLKEEKELISSVLKQYKDKFTIDVADKVSESEED